jgi:uncharacterized membrane protein YesL
LDVLAGLPGGEGVAGMNRAGRFLWECLLDAYDSFSQLMVANLLWFSLTLPILTAPPAAAGLYYYTHELASNHAVDWHTFFEGFRKYFWRSWLWALANLVAIIVFGINAWFYNQVKTSWAPWVAGLSIGLLVIWLLLQFFTFPLLLEQTDQRLRVAIRNSAVLYLKRPGPCIGLVLFLVPLAALSFVIPPLMIIIYAAVAAFLVNRWVIYLLEDIFKSQKISSSQIADQRLDSISTFHKGDRAK